MKTILITLALVGFTATGSYAQNKDCGCKKKVAHHRVIHHTRTVRELSPYSARPFIPAPTLIAVGNDEAEQPCYMYRKHNIVVRECPSVFYQNTDMPIEYGTSNTYMGYFPNKESRGNDAAGEIAPQHTTIDHYRGVAPAGGNGCNGYCSPQ